MTAKPPLITILDDEPEIRRMLQDALERQNAVVKELRGHAAVVQRVLEGDMAAAVGEIDKCGQLA